MARGDMLILQVASIFVGILLLAVHSSWLVEAKFNGQNDAFLRTGKYVNLGYIGYSQLGTVII